MHQFNELCSKIPLVIQSYNFLISQKPFRCSELPARGSEERDWLAGHDDHKEFAEVTPRGEYEESGWWTNAKVGIRPGFRDKSLPICLLFLKLYQLKIVVIVSLHYICQLYHPFCTLMWKAQQKHKCIGTFRGELSFHWITIIKMYTLSYLHTILIGN